MSVAGYIVIGIVILFVLLVYLLFLLAYIVYSYRCKSAIRGQATIIEDLGDMKLATGSHAVGIPRFRTYHKYKVSLFVDGVEYIDEAELKDRALKIGDIIEIRYDITSKGKVELMSEAFLSWTREMAVGYTLGIIVGVVGSILHANGII